MNKSRILLASVIAILIITFFVFDLGQYFDLDNFKARKAEIEAYHQANPLRAALYYFLLYIAVTGLSLPGATLMTLAGGAVFGLLWATLLVSFASTIGATFAFLASRFLLRDVVQNRFVKSMKTINEGMRKDGAFYLFTLRLVPLFPFVVINLAMGLTPIRTLTFFLISQAGMLAGTIVYVNAGTQIAKIESLGDILSPELVLSFALLGIFPLIAKKIVDFIRGHRALWKFARPRRFDRNLIVIGAGSAGLVASYIAAAVKAKVTLIEKYRMGGDCLNTGCVPSKALIRSARILALLRRAPEFGLQCTDIDSDFAAVMERVQRVIRTVEPHDSVERYTGLGVECIQGTARITSPYSVEVNGRTLTTRSIVIATGARPAIPPIPGIEATAYVTSDTVWELRKLPDRLLVLGGGAIGCELAQCFARFGSRVVQVVRGERLLAAEDPEVSELLLKQFRTDGIDVRTGHRAVEFSVRDGARVLHCDHGGERTEIRFDTLLVATGRVANTTGFGLEELGIPVTPRHTIESNAFLQTLYPNIYVCGDVAGPFQFTHTASHQAWYAAVNSLFGNLRRFRADYSVIPHATFTEPEIARVGLNEQEARQQDISFEVTRYDIDDLDRAIADGEARGFVKVLTVPGKDRILGVTIAGEHAGDIIAEYILAMRHGLGMNRILGTIHIYPTLAEANKFAAGAWKRAHAPQRLLRWLERYHAWRRG